MLGYEVLLLGILQEQNHVYQNCIIACGPNKSQLGMPMQSLLSLVIPLISSCCEFKNYSPL